MKWIAVATAWTIPRMFSDYASAEPGRCTKAFTFAFCIAELHFALPSAKSAAEMKLSDPKRKELQMRMIRPAVWPGLEKPSAGSNHGAPDASIRRR